MPEPTPQPTGDQPEPTPQLTVIDRTEDPDGDFTVTFHAAPRPA